ARPSGPSASCWLRTDASALSTLSRSTSGAFSFFFFSSRRRHTRCLSDWSSDVCSSDLQRTTSPARICGPHQNRAFEANMPGRRRSEERRVGKECRSGGAPEHLKKKEDITSDA